MEKAKVFISHSHKDEIIAKALVDLLMKIGLDSNDIIASSAPKAQLHVGTSIYSELKTALSNKDVLVIFLLSDNFYSSTVCMNEMGAAWIKNAKYYVMVLPGFSFDKIEGVILENTPVGISLTSCDESNKIRIAELCRAIACRYKFDVSDDTIELGLINFFSFIDKYKMQLAGTHVFHMDNAKGFCINDTENDGCRIWKRESSNTKTTAILDFLQTDSKLCSISYHLDQKDWSSFKADGKVLSFEVYSDAETFQAEVELHFIDHNESVTFLIADDTQTCRIPLSQFNASDADWKIVKELCFLFRKKHVDHRTTVVIENIRLEG